MGYRPKPYPTQILRDLLRSCWDTTYLPRPTIIEKPSPEYQRMDLYNDSPHIVVSAGDIEETLIHIAFQNLSITVPMEIEIHTAAHPDEMEAKFDGLDRGEMESHRFRRQLLHDYAEEVQKIILLWQHDPNIYLVGDFEDEDEEETLRYWDRDSDIELSIENDNPNSAYGDGCLEITGTAIYNIPDDIEDEETNPLPLIPRPTGRLRVLKLFAKAQDTTTDLIVKLVFPPVLDMDNNEIHNGEIILVDGRTMSDEYEDYWLDIESEMKKS